MKNKISGQNISIIPLGGLGAIGKNITLIEYRGDIIIIDCGISFPDDETPGVDLIIPDFSYIRENRKKIKAVIITHGHEDHIGGIPYLLREINVPIYATRLTIGLIQSRLAEHTLSADVTFIEVHPRDVHNIGRFSIEFIRVNHSVSDGVAAAITTGVGTIIHTGDFKIDFSPVDGEVIDLYKFAEYGERGVLLLLSDSTNAERPGFTKSESSLTEKLIDIFSSSKGRIIVATFASNIHRIQQVVDTARRFNKKVVISGLSMQKNVEISTTLGYLNMKDSIIEIEQAKSYPDKKLVIIGTGTQGEPMSALSRMAFGTHKHFKIKNGDTVIITASVIPGKEKMLNNVVNTMMSYGAEVYNDEIHVSGHASINELELILAVTKPKFFMPIHGEYKHLKAHAKLAESIGIKQSNIMIAENGDILELTYNSFVKKEKIELARIYVHGSETGDTAGKVISDRQVMANEGVLIVTLLVSEGFLIGNPEVRTRGVFDEENIDLIARIKKDAAANIKKMLKKNQNPVEVEETLRRGLRNLLYKLTKRNSLIVVQIIEV
ncbi:MAG: ribonuclease J [Spirochaetia bacterium]|jgi:ribonuclease J|nr:ribonuclease J [Spirochaetia bacterium]